MDEQPPRRRTADAQIDAGAVLVLSADGHGFTTCRAHISAQAQNVELIEDNNPISEYRLNATASA